MYGVKVEPLALEEQKWMGILMISQGLQVGEDRVYRGPLITEKQAKGMGERIEGCGEAFLRVLFDEKNSSVFVDIVSKETGELVNRSIERYSRTDLRLLSIGVEI